jgi:hypothetical protein
MYSVGMMGAIPMGLVHGTMSFVFVGGTPLTVVTDGASELFRRVVF